MTERLRIGRGLFLVAAVLLAVACAPQHTTVVQKTTDDAEMHFKQGMMYAGRGDYDNAIMELQQSIAVKPTSKAYSNLGVAYMKTGKTNKALDALQKATNLDSCDPFAQYNLAAVYSVMDKTDLGMDALDQALECGFNNYDAIRFDKDLNNLRAEPEFRQTLEKHKVFLQ
jgi:Flp pilus assembly protein TadD